MKKQNIVFLRGMNSVKTIFAAIVKILFVYLDHRLISGLYIDYILGRFLEIPIEESNISLLTSFIYFL